MAIELVSDPTEEGFNSFVSIEQATEYFSGTYFSDPNADTWDDLDPDDQARLLITASRRLSALNWTGVPIATTQVLAFPRSYTAWEYGGTVDLGENDMPNFLVELVCEMARALWEEPSQSISTADFSQFKSIDVGPISVTLRDGSSAFFPERILTLLGRLSPAYLLLGGKVRSVSMYF
jgi:hypothetical protein